jgi:hypothetical protein
MVLLVIYSEMLFLLMEVQQLLAHRLMTIMVLAAARPISLKNQVEFGIKLRN